LRSIGGGELGSNLRLLGSLLDLNDGLLRHGSEDNNVGVLLVNLEELDDLLSNLTVRHADIILGVAVIVHQGEETIVRDVE